MVNSAVNDGRLLAAIVFALTAALLNGCAAGMVAVPLVMTGTSMAGSGNRSPFVTHAPNPQQQTDHHLAMLDAQIRRAQCGDAESQYRLAFAMKNDFNANPNNVEIYKWFRLAQMGEFEPATQELETLTVVMSSSEVALARERARQWQPSSTNCAVSGQG